MMESFKHCVTAFDIYFGETHEFWFSTDRKFANNDNVYRYNFNFINKEKDKKTIIVIYRFKTLTNSEIEYFAELIKKDFKLEGYDLKRVSKKGMM